MSAQHHPPQAAERPTITAAGRQRPRRQGPLLARIGALLSVVLLCLTLMPAASGAEAGRWLDSASYAELTQELAALQGPDGTTAPTLTQDQQRRVADLSQLQQAIAVSDDRSQILNNSAHNLGLFILSKKAPAEAAPDFVVLAPGHESDDDVSVQGLLIPAGVSLRWGESGSLAAAAAGRVLRLPEGERLQISDPAAAATNPADETGTGTGVTIPAATSPVLTYSLSLPPFSVQQSLSDLAVLPALSQEQLDAEAETAPLD